MTQSPLDPTLEKNINTPDIQISTPFCVALEPVWVVPEKPESISIPVYLSPAYVPLRHKLICQLQTENQHVQEWDFLPERESLQEPTTALFPGWSKATLSLPSSIETGYHELRILDKTTDQSISMCLIVTPAKCYQPPAIRQKQKQLPDRQGHVWGISLDLMHVSSQKNWGIGDLSDLIRIIDWCAAQGADFIQLDPLLGSFSYPNFLFLNIEAIEDFSECSEARKRVFNPTFQQDLKKHRETTNPANPEIARQKLEILHLLYRSFDRNHIKKNSFRAHAFKTYLQKQGQKLERFSLYQALQEYFEREDPAIQNWQSWPKHYQYPGSSAVLEFALTNSERIGFYQYLQWQLEIQLQAAGLRSLEHRLGIGLCLSLPRLSAINQSDTWAHRHLFSENCTIGMPPNEQVPLGQSGTSPPLLPEPLRTEGYQFFIDTIRHLMQHAGAIRIEHITGLMQQFWIPHELSPQQGTWVDYPINDLLGILALESQRNHCLIIGDEPQGFLPEFQNKLLAWGILPSQTFCFEPSTELTEIQEMALLSPRSPSMPKLSDFWSGQDIQDAIVCEHTSKKERDSQIKNRMLARIAILERLEQANLLPENITTDPMSVPKMTQDLNAAIHQLLAQQPAKLLSVFIDDFSLKQDASPVSATQALPVPLEDWWTDENLLVISQAIQTERPHHESPVLPELEPDLKLDERASLLMPRATYRLQFNKDFTFKDATNLVPYLNRLGISHCYASPLLKARPGSPHGYDITDHQQFNQDIGTLEDFRHLSDRLRLHGMGLIMDIVPNHMGAGQDNFWWTDVLENGPSSLYAEYFDIDWNPLADDLQNKILLAILGESYGKILENGEIQLNFEPDSGRFWLHYWDHRVPIDPMTYPIVLGHRLEVLETRLGHQDNAWLEYQSLLSALENLPVETQHDFLRKEERERERTIALNRLISLYRQTPEILAFIEENVQEFQSKKDDPPSLNRLNRLLEKQNYRLANWRVASDEINYRRFFDINDLVAVRVEDERVFRDTHAWLMNLIEQGQIQGVRIDHPDGLYDPSHYFKRLQTEAARHLGLPENGKWYLGSSELPFYILIEKILAPFERLPEDWTVHGTTGYEFANAVNGLFIRQENEKDLTRLYEKFIGHRIDFDELCYESKKLIMKTALNSELGVLTHQLHRLSKAHWSYQDFTLHNLRSALIEIVACFPVYRAYVTETQISQKDREYIEWAIRAAKRRNLATDESVFDFIHNVLLTDVGLARETSEFQSAVTNFAMKFQQYSSPVMAKGIEDTAFYRYNRLVSINEVGGDPRQFGISAAHFHYQNLERAKRVPCNLLATSTHDAKRSEDVRARISVLSEMPQEWAKHVNYWRRANRPYRGALEEGIPAPSPNDEYLFYQSLLGIWPFHHPNEPELESLTQRMEQYMLKAVREAKEYTSWVNPNDEYEAALSYFIRQVLMRPSKLFMEDFLAFHKSIARLGAFNSLSQTLLKLTCPGVPDLYQGSELFEFTLVDPDNREPVDYTQRLQSLRQIDEMLELRDGTAFHQQLASLCQDMSDGRLKQFTISTALRFRSAQPPLFREGNYIPLEVTGYQAEHIVAFARCWNGLSSITVVPRLLYTLGLRKKDRPCGRRIWRDTMITLPEQLVGQSFRGLFDWQHFGSSNNPPRTLLVADILRHLPVGLLVAN